MNDVVCFQRATGREDRFACGTPTDLSALLHDRWSAGAMDRAIHASATSQSAVCRVDDCIG
jgi:hypothetical protein